MNAIELCFELEYAEEMSGDQEYTCRECGIECDGEVCPWCWDGLGDLDQGQWPDWVEDDPFCLPMLSNDYIDEAPYL